MASDQGIYRHSGECPSAGIALGLVAGVTCAAVMGIAYAYVALYCDYEKLIMISGGLFGFASGSATWWGLRAGKVRNTPIATLLAATVAGIGWYVSWGFYLSALTIKAGERIAPSLILGHPSLLWALVRNLQQYAAQESGSTAVWARWMTEAGGIIAIAACAPYATDRPFCERCDSWCEQQGGLQRLTIPEDTTQIRQRLLARDFTCLSEITHTTEAADQTLLLTLFSCPHGRDLHVLSIGVMTNQHRMKHIDIQKLFRRPYIVRGLTLNASEVQSVLKAAYVAPSFDGNI